MQPYIKRIEAASINGKYAVRAFFDEESSEAEITESVGIIIRQVAKETIHAKLKPTAAGTVVGFRKKSL